MQNLKRFPQILCMAKRTTSQLPYLVLVDHCRLPHAMKQWTVVGYPISYINVRFASTLTTEEKLKKTDNIPDLYKIIYRAPLYNYVVAVHGSLMAGALILTSSVIERYISSNLVIDYEIAVFLLGFLYMFGTASRLISIYILRIYTNEKGSYIVVKSGFLPLTFSKFNCSRGEIHRIKPSGIMPWKYNRSSVKNKSYIILEHYFRKPSDFNSMISETIR